MSRARPIDELFRSPGPAADLLRATDWSATPVGPVSAWSLSFISIVRAMLSTQQATCLFWGPALVNLYNDGFIPILGEKHPTAMGQNAELCWSDAWPVVGGLLNGVVTQGKAVLFTEMLVPIVRHGKLEDAWWNYSYSPVFDDDGAVAGVLVVATEITTEVSVRKQLEAAKVAAEAANRAKDEFLAVVSHELRTPLNAILGWSRLLADKTELRWFEKGLAVIERNATAQAKLIDDILDVSGIISGKVRLELRRVRLTHIIQNVVESIRPAATAKRIRVELLLEDGDAELVADEVRLQQVVWNLVSNAVKFTPVEGLIRVTAGRDSSRLSLRVQDSGKGISSEFLPYVFDRFRQDDTGTTRHFGGLGLGLAIVRHIVELHGGSVEAHSEGADRGAMFHVSLPIRAVEPRPASERPDAAVGSQRESQPAEAALRKGILAGARVLVLDDEDDARELVATVMLDAGALVTEAPSVEAARAVLASNRIEAIVSDVGMPSEDGYSFVARLRSDTLPDAQHIPALALTAFARHEDRERAIAAGFQEHLAKPVDPDRLVRAVATLLGRA